jgi:hypothetical protein
MPDGPGVLRYLCENIINLSLKNKKNITGQKNKCG